MSNAALPPIDPKIGLMVCAAEHLIPLFKAGDIETSLARRMAISALYAYEPETRADFVNAARTIAFSMAALALLGKAASNDMTIAEQMKAYGRANALNRSADQSERAMTRRRCYQQANLPDQPPDQASEPPPPDRETDDAQMQAAIAGAMAEYLATRTQPNTDTPAPETVPPEPAPPPPAARPATPATAIHCNGPRSDAGQQSYKQGLLRHSAINRVISQTGTPPQS